MRLAAMGLAGLAVAGCTTTMGAKPPQPGAECDGAKAQAFVGRDGAAISEDARVAAGAKAVRVIGPDQAVTMDFRPDRLNLETDQAGKVLKARCG